MLRYCADKHWTKKAEGGGEEEKEEEKEKEGKEKREEKSRRTRTRTRRTPTNMQISCIRSSAENNFLELF